jgi:chromosome segregation ATPase
VEFKASEANLETRAVESNKPGVASVAHKRSFDCGVSMLTSSCASSTSGEGRDEKLQSPTKSNTLSHDATEFIRLKQEYDLARDKISSLQNNLRERETEAELATQKLENREGDLKDVIQRYKDLHEEYKKFLTSDDPYTPNNAHVKLIQERDAARWKVSEMEGELRQAKVSVTAAVTKQNLAKQHLRDVIFQYKTLQREHEALVHRIEGLRVDLPSSNTSSRSQKNNSAWRATSQEEKRDTASPQAQHLRPIVEADDRSYLSARSGTHPFVNDIDSVRSFGSGDAHTTKSGKKKPLYKSLYKEVKKTFVKPVKPRRREVLRIDGLS